MTDKISLKKQREYNSSDRFLYLNAVEDAGKRMIRRLDSYLQINEIGPEIIGVRVGFYQPAMCLSMLRTEIKRRELTSRLEFTENGREFPQNSLVFDLDEMADEYIESNREDYLK